MQWIANPSRAVRLRHAPPLQNKSLAKIQTLNKRRVISPHVLFGLGLQEPAESSAIRLNVPQLRCLGAQLPFVVRNAQVPGVPS